MNNYSLGLLFDSTGTKPRRAGTGLESASPVRIHLEPWSASRLVIISFPSLFSLDAFVFEKSSQIQFTTPIYNVIPGDFTLDGRLDILVMSANSGTTLNMDLYRGNRDGTFRMYMICASTFSGCA